MPDIKRGHFVRKAFIYIFTLFKMAPRPSPDGEEAQRSAMVRVSMFGML